MAPTSDHTSTTATRVASSGILLSLRHDARVEPSTRVAGSEAAAEGVMLAEGHVRSSFRPRSPGVRAALDSLVSGPVDEDALFATAMDLDGDHGAISLQLLLKRLDEGGWVERTAVADERPLARLVPLGHVIEPSPRVVRASDVVRLSRFAVIRRDAAGMLGESPLSASQVRLVDPSVLILLGACTEAVSVAELPGRRLGLSPIAVEAVAQLLVAAAVLQFHDEALDDHPSLQMWTVPDLLFHSRSRAGRHEGGYGGTYKWEGTVSPAPAVRPPFEGGQALPRIDLEATVRSDPPFGEVVRARRSVRAHDDEHPVTRIQLAELLQRVAMVEAVFHDGHQELSTRPVPSGGALHELEIYPLVSLCDGLEPGLYHYDAGAHTVSRIAEADPRTILLAEYAKRTAAMTTVPQVTLLLTARFDRAMWKYEAMAYALTLKHVGVLYESLYLTTTAMGLAGCALGGGNSDAFARASGLDRHREATVGEFLVGSPAPGGAARDSGWEER